MVITEELKRTLLPLTEEELKEISYSKEELIKYAIDMFNKECDKIDAMYDEELDSQ